jgi:hypothetical protein
MTITLPPLLDRLDRTSRKLDPLLPTKQIQQNKHSLVWPQNREQTNLLAQGTVRTVSDADTKDWPRNEELRSRGGN